VPSALTRLAVVTVTSVAATALLTGADEPVADPTSATVPAAAPSPVEPATELVRKPAPLPTATSDAATTVATAEASAYNVPGQCLNWSREQAGIPSLYADAATAWEHAADRHAGDTDPPAGAAVYWLGGSGGHGHVAISLGGGRVRSSDAGGYGVVGTIQLERLTREWGLEYAGWSDSINGYRIPGVADA
jgi:hypothetical protein